MRAPEAHHHLVMPSSCSFSKTPLARKDIARADAALLGRVAIRALQ